MADFVAQLRKLSEHCECRDKRLQCKLLAEPRLTLEKAFSTAQSMELAEKGTESSQEGQRIPTRGTETLAVTDVGEKSLPATTSAIIAT